MIRYFFDIFFSTFSIIFLIFFNLAEIDFLLSQQDGCKYIVLYQMLCLQIANNNGELASRLGEMIIPYDADKIVRDTKYFSRDTVIVAMELFKKLNLIYTEEENCFRIAGFEILKIPPRQMPRGD